MQKQNTAAESIVHIYKKGKTKTDESCDKRRIALVLRSANHSNSRKSIDEDTTSCSITKSCVGGDGEGSVIPGGIQTELRLMVERD